MASTPSSNADLFRLSYEGLDLLRAARACGDSRAFLRRLLHRNHGMYLSASRAHLEALAEAQIVFASRNPPLDQLQKELGPLVAAVPPHILAACGRSWEDLPRLGHYAAVLLQREDLQNKLRVR